MSIADKISRLQTAKENISDAITAQGGTVAEGDGFEEFANDIESISTGQVFHVEYSISSSEPGKLSKITMTPNSDFTLVFPDTVTAISNDIFTMYNPVITKIVMHNNITNIFNGGVYGPVYNGAFAWCYNVNEIVLSENLTNIGDYAFYGTGITSIYIPMSVTYIGSYAFKHTNLTDVYYGGTSSDWQSISVDAFAFESGVNFHYESTYKVQNATTRPRCSKSCL